MAKKTTVSESNVFNGMDRKETIQKFIKFEEMDYVKGTFLGTKQVSSKEFKLSQTCWIVEIEKTSCKDYAGETVKTGDKVLIPEKATMESMRMELEEGVVFGLVYEGEKMSRDGKRKFKDFSLYM